MSVEKMRRPGWPARRRGTSTRRSPFTRVRGLVETLEPKRLLASDNLTIYLIDAETDQRLTAVAQGQVIEVAEDVADALSLEAVPGNPTLGGQIQSMRLAIAGPVVNMQVENVVPYALFGDRSGNFAGRAFATGEYSASFSGFASAQAQGSLVAQLDLNFRIEVDAGVVDPPPPPPPPTTDPVDPDPRVHGELMTWHEVVVDFTGPTVGETRATFYDYRLDVTFSHPESGESYVVPGFFAADGDAGQTGATSGDVWRVRFNPSQTGTWTFSASFREGTNLAASTDPAAGTASAFIDGASGSFDVTGSDKTGEDFRAKGRLQYVGEHYLIHAGTGEHFIKAGADSPENFLAYSGFDNTRDTHAYTPHLQDWNAGDPQWGNAQGREIIGAVNYLADKGVNSLYMLTHNVAGDGRDVWPWTDPNLGNIGKNSSNIAASRVSAFDVSKLAQWEVVFDHMDANGVAMHLITQETENDQLLNGNNLGTERAIYYREMISRFAHHNGVFWNLGEENTNPTSQRKAFADYFEAVDPYDHLVVIHTFPGQINQVYDPLLGHPSFDGPSLQTNTPRSQVTKWRQESAEAGHKWVVNWDETGPANRGVDPDPAYNPAFSPNNQDDIRERMWGVLTAGGAGVEWYFGYQNPHNDLNLEDFRSRDSVWTWTSAASEFFEALPVLQMQQSDNATTDGDDFVFADPGAIYTIYQPQGGGTTTLNLTGVTGTFRVEWFDPRFGGTLQTTAITEIGGGGTVNLGAPPARPDDDWVILVTKTDDGDPVDPPPPPPPPAQDDLRIYLVDAVADVRLGLIEDGATVVIDPSLIDNLSIEAVPESTNLINNLESLRFALNGPVAHNQLENFTPYALFGDRSGDFTGRPFTEGTYALDVTGYDANGGGGQTLVDLDLTFTLSTTATPPPAPPAPSASGFDEPFDAAGPAETPNVITSDFPFVNGLAIATQDSSGSQRFVDTSLQGMSSPQAIIDLAAVAQGKFEAIDPAVRDTFSVYVSFSGGNFELLDAFLVDEPTQIFHGSLTGQTFSDDASQLVYDLPVGAASAQLRIDASTSSNTEEFRIDRVRIVDSAGSESFSSGSSSKPGSGPGSLGMKSYSGPALANLHLSLVFGMNTDLISPVDLSGSSEDE